MKNFKVCKKKETLGYWQLHLSFKTSKIYADLKLNGWLALEHR